MATSESATFGLSHPTVVPANFQPEDGTCSSCGQELSERGE